MPYMSLYTRERCVDKDEEIDLQLEYMGEEYCDEEVEDDG